MYISTLSWFKLDAQIPSTCTKNLPIWTLGGSKICPTGALLGSKRGSEIDSGATKNSMGRRGVPGGQGGGAPPFGGTQNRSNLLNLAP